MELNLPPGLFNTLLNFWTILRNTYVAIISNLTSWAVHIGNVEFSLLMVLIGPGVTALISITILKKLLP